MKAVLWTKYGSPDLLQYGEVEKPVPKDDEVLIKVQAATVTPGDCEMRRFDMHVLFWLPLRIYMGIWKPKRPILGMELAGEIEAAGKDVTQFKQGDQVFAGTGIRFGAYAQYKCIKANSFMALKPANLSYEEVATIPTGAINALHYIKLGKIQPGEKVLINGAGGCFGTYAVQLAKMFGAEVTAVDSTEKLGLLKEIGADETIDFTKEDYFNNPEIYDVIFDIAGKGSVTKGMRALKPTGRYILATPWVGLVLQGRWASWTSSKKFFCALAKDDPRELVYLKELMEAGKIKAVIDRTYPLNEMAAAHHYVEDGEKVGHVAIKIEH